MVASASLTNEELARAIEAKKAEFDRFDLDMVRENRCLKAIGAEWFEMEQELRRRQQGKLVAKPTTQ